MNIVVWHTLAASLPCISVILFSVITRSKWVGVIATLILIAASAYEGFFHNEWIISLDVASIPAGYVIIDNLEFHEHQDQAKKIAVLYYLFCIINTYLIKVHQHIKMRYKYRNEFISAPHPLYMYKK